MFGVFNAKIFIIYSNIFLSYKMNHYFFVLILGKVFRSNMSCCKFKEIIVVEDFNIGNGVLGLNRDIYLNIVKFLSSSMVRKV
jgi:hypothetical protein